MTTNRRLFSVLDRLMLVYCFGAAIGSFLLVFVFRSLGLPGEIPLFLVPAALGLYVIDRAYREGRHQSHGLQSQGAAE